MSKKTIFCLFLTAVIALCAGCTAGPQESSADPSAESFDESAVADIIEQIDMSGFDENGYTITFSQKYKVTKRTDNEQETAELVCDYEGTGSFTRLTEPAGADASAGKLELFANGKGYLDQSQWEKAVYTIKETDKVYNESRESKETVDRNRYFRARFDEKTLNVSFRTAPDGDPTFEGSIEKDLLSGILSDELLDRFTDSLIFMDSYSYLDRLNGFSASAFSPEESISEENMSKYMDPADLNVSFEEGIFTLTFSIYGDTAFEELKENPPADGNRGKIFCTIQYDTSAGQIVRFRYDLKDFLLAVFRLSGKDGETVDAQIEEFAIEGNRLNVSFDRTALKGDFTVYTDASAFLDKLGTYTAPAEGPVG